MKRIHTFIITCAAVIVTLLTGCTAQEMPDKINSPAKTSPSTFVSLEEATNDLLGLVKDLEDNQTRATSGQRRIGDSYVVTSGRSTRSTRSDSVQPRIYIINFENNQGYAIMSADNRMPSLLAFVEFGHITPGDTLKEPGLVVFLSNMEEYYRKKPKIDLDKYKKDDGTSEMLVKPNEYYWTYGPWENIVYKQNGYCPVKWGQGSPYYNYCPKADDPQYVHKAAGCVPVSVAQLMACHKYPKECNGYTYDWNEMTRYYAASGIKPVYQNQVARLIQQLGKNDNLDVNYGDKQSGAKAKHSIRTLRHFGYSNPGVMNNYNTDSVVSEIKSGHPVLCSGYSDKKDYKIFGWTIWSQLKSGHAWLIHGMLERKRFCYLNLENEGVISTSIETEYYPLCNWGWEGLHDGYFLSGVFDAAGLPEYTDYGTDLSIPSDNNGEGEHDHYYQYGIKTITKIRK